jgi:hypothetical protein
VVEKREIVKAELVRDEFHQAAQVFAGGAETRLLLKLIDQARPVYLTFCTPHGACTRGLRRRRPCLQATPHKILLTGAVPLPPLNMRFSSATG